MGDSYRDELERRRNRSGKSPSKMGRKITQAEIEKQAAIRWRAKKKKAQQLKLW